MYSIYMSTPEPINHKPPIDKIEMEKDVKALENVVDDILEITEPQYVAPVDYCFGFCNGLIDLFLTWLYDAKVKNV